jgi:hypothetical protein
VCGFVGRSVLAGEWPYPEWSPRLALLLDRERTDYRATHERSYTGRRCQRMGLLSCVRSWPARGLPVHGADDAREGQEHRVLPDQRRATGPDDGSHSPTNSGR